MADRPAEVGYLPAVSDPPPPPPPPASGWRGLGRGKKIGIAVATLFGLLFGLVVIANATGFLRTYRIPSPAMSPTIKVGDHILVAKMSFPFSGPHRGDIVVFYPPSGSETQQCGVPASPADGHPCASPTPGRSRNTFIKRIVALPGEWIKIENNRVLRAPSEGGPFKQAKEPFIAPGTPCDQLCNLPKPIQVPDGHYYVLGDNRGESDDSRDWGPIPRSAMIGRRIVTY
jgi:signal peptidase I